MAHKVALGPDSQHIFSRPVFPAAGRSKSLESSTEEELTWGLKLFLNERQRAVAAISFHSADSTFPLCSD